MTLFELHRKYDSLKTRDKHPSTHSYIKKIYPSFFDSRKDEELKILELGVYRGGALKAMRDYLPKAQLIGVDISPETVSEDRIKVITGSQSDSFLLKKVGEEHGPFDFIIEDGSHNFYEQKISLDTMLPFLKVNGVFFFEDIIPAYNGSYIFNYVISTYLRWEYFLSGSTPYSIFFYPGMVALQRNY